MDLILSQCVDQILHAQSRILCIFAAGETRHQVLECNERILRCLRVALGGS